MIADTTLVCLLAFENDQRKLLQLKGANVIRARDFRRKPLEEQWQYDLLCWNAKEIKGMRGNYHSAGMNCPCIA